MRARTIKPGFFSNDVLAECEPLARLLFAGLWTVADREGRLEDRPKKIKAEVLPYDDCDIESLLNQLAEYGFVTRYKVNGVGYIQINNFNKHQNPHMKEVGSSIPAPDEKNTKSEQELSEHHTSTVLAPTLTGTDRALSLLPSPLSITLTSEDKSSSVKMVAPKEKFKPPEYPPEFDEFWREYPKTADSKQTAFKAYQKAIKTTGVSHENLITGVRKSREYLEATGTPPKHPSTFLNKRSWEVDYDAALTEQQRIAGCKSQNGGGKSVSKWLTEGERLAAKYRAEAEVENLRQGGS